MDIRNQRLCAWSGAVFLVLFVVGWVLIGGFLPPPSPTLGAAEVAVIYQAHATTIRLGLLVSQASLVFFVPWVAVLSAQMKRIEGGLPVLADTQLISGAGAMLAILAANQLWSITSFRPDRNPDVLLMMHDLGWLVFTMTFAPFVSQGLAIAAAIFGDRGAVPVFPRWAAYLNVWTVVLFLPAGIIVFFKKGPFAWDGLVTFWVPVTVFFFWFLLMLPLVFKAIRQQEGSPPPVGTAAG